MSTNAYYVNHVLTEHKHKYKKEAYVYAYVAAVFTSALSFLCLFLCSCLRRKVRTGLLASGSEIKKQGMVTSPVIISFYFGAERCEK